jgi:hypothetical protein
MSAPIAGDQMAAYLKGGLSKKSSSQSRARIMQRPTSLIKIPISANSQSSLMRVSLYASVGTRGPSRKVDSHAGSRCGSERHRNEGTGVQFKGQQFDREKNSGEWSRECRSHVGSDPQANKRRR